MIEKGSFQNSILILCHPDDECLFSSSILEEVSTIIICFSKIHREKEISSGRVKALLNYPLKNTKFISLNLDQAKPSPFSPNWSNIKETNLNSVGLELDQSCIHQPTGFASILLEEPCYKTAGPG